MTAPRPRTGGHPGLVVITNWRDLDHPEAGGAEVVCQQLAAGLASAGHRVVLLCASVKGRPAREERDGYAVVRGGGRFTVYLHALLWLLRRRGRVDAVIDSQNGIPFFTPLVAGARTPVLMLLHHVHQDQFAKYFPAPVAAVGRWLESAGSRAVYGRRGVVAVSPSTRRDARRRLGLQGEIWVAPPGWSVVRPVGAVRTIAPSIVCVGRLVPHKRTELILEAFPTVLRRYPDATLTIVGRGSEAEPLQHRAAELGLTDAVSFRSDLDDAGRDRLLATAWFSVHASQGEGWGLSVIEGNALGVPVLAYRRPGLKDSIVDGETGWLVEDDEDLGEAMVGCVTDLAQPVVAEAFSAAARAWADRFTWDAMTSRVLGALDAERIRLGWGDKDRRARSDTATVITVPLTVVRTNWRGAVRGSDVWEESDGHVVALCRGADTQTVRAVLDRLGVAPPDRDVVDVRVAGTRDLLRLRQPVTQGSS